MPKSTLHLKVIASLVYFKAFLLKVKLLKGQVTVYLHCIIFGAISVGLYVSVFFSLSVVLSSLLVERYMGGVYFDRHAVLCAIRVGT